jgi:MFS transporter, BCD family, chlorophyll transporter
MTEPGHTPQAATESATADSGLASFWQGVGARFLPFADAATPDLPLGRLVRLALFQVSVGFVAVLLSGTLNRVLIVEMDIPAWIVALLIAIPLVAAPFRALIGHRSDRHRSVLGWRRVPYIWFGTLAMFGGLAIMPFALILMTRADSFAPGLGAASLSFLLTGTGMHVTQTAGLALATDLASPESRPRVVGLLYAMLLVGMTVAAFSIASLLQDFSYTRLVQVIQGAAAICFMLNIAALWKQEPRRRSPANAPVYELGFAQRWGGFIGRPLARRLLGAIGLGAAGFAMQDALLEPYGGEALALAVGETTALTGAWAIGALVAFGYSSARLASGNDPLRLAGLGTVAGIGAFLLIIFAAPLGSPTLLFAGALFIGFGTGLFSAGTMVAAMALADAETAGMALGAWGAVQATSAGLGVALGGMIRDAIAGAAMAQQMGQVLASPGTAYAAIYLIEIAILLITLVVLGPLIGKFHTALTNEKQGLGLSEFPT